ncbi:SipW-dependent-type signal peptide-containing protein [Halolamina sp. C58]|uniref:SipW-dependent-type signal peptide-containing protein n=1 Tax=Halolamina sp. C58 TaxID=3421640 RepID=UPI003EBB9CF1
MSDDRHHYRLSRRNVHVGVDSVGLASAGASLGTTAFLSETETFEENTITAKAMDARRDWEQKCHRDNRTEYVSAFPEQYENDPNSRDELRTNSPAVEDETPPERPFVFEGTLGELLTAVDDGIPLDGHPDTTDRDCFPQDQPGDEQVRYRGFEWAPPASVGNVVPGDSVTFDLTFVAVQRRNNDGTTSPVTGAQP